MELGIGLRINYARRTVLVRVSGLVLIHIIFSILSRDYESMSFGLSVSQSVALSVRNPCALIGLLNLVGSRFPSSLLRFEFYWNNEISLTSVSLW